MNEFNDFCSLTKSLLSKRQLLGTRKKGVESFCDAFRSFGWFYHTEHKDGFEMLNSLLDDNNLFDGNLFNTNFALDILSFWPKLKDNKTWNSLIHKIIGFTAERIGAGEFFLCLTVAGWEYKIDSKGDGYVAHGKREVKANTASLKPNTNTQSRIIDEINRTILDGHRLGPLNETTKSNGQSFANGLIWLRAQGDITAQVSILTRYFTKLYPGKDINDIINMCDRLVKTDDGQEFYNIIGIQVLIWYKNADKWESLSIVDTETMKFVNIADITDFNALSAIKFEWISKRGGDTRTMGDGYVNVSIKRPLVVKSPKSKSSVLNSDFFV